MTASPLKTGRANQINADVGNEFPLLDTLLDQNGKLFDAIVPCAERVKILGRKIFILIQTLKHIF